MAFEPEFNRHSIRLKEYDYSKPGGYFITICVQDRKSLLGEIVESQAKPSEPGIMVQKWWDRLPDKFERIDIDEFVIMPNHIHGIIFIKDTVGANQCVCPNPESPEPRNLGGHAGPPLPRIVQWFKTMTTNEYFQNVRDVNWPAVYRRFWQRNYYEHIIRDERDLFNARKYILENPLKWEDDEFYSDSR